MNGIRVAENCMSLRLEYLFPFLILKLGDLSPPVPLPPALWVDRQPHGCPDGAV